MRRADGGVPVAALGGLVFCIALLARLPIALTRPLDGDEAVQGIAAQHLLDHGHWAWYFPGQRYAGTLEIIPQALLQAIDKGSAFLLRLPLILIAAGTVVLLSYLALELTRSRLSFLAVGMIASLSPATLVYFGSWQTAGYNASAFLSVLAVLLVAGSMRSPISERRRLLLVGAAGLSAGLAAYEQPMAVFLLAALGTTVLVATWPRSGQLLGLRYLVAFAGLALLGALPEIVGLAGGLGSNSVNDPLPPGYHLTPQLLATVAGFNPSPDFVAGIFPSDNESMAWNALGFQWIAVMNVPRAVAMVATAAVWVWAILVV